MGWRTTLWNAKDASSEGGAWAAIPGARGKDLALMFGVRPQDVGSTRIVVMSFGFLFIFMAFNTIQTILSTVLQHFNGCMTGLKYDLGNASLMIMYLAACPSLYVVPSVIKHYGSVATLIISGLCYALYITSLVYVWEPTVLASSCVVGFGQAAIWVSQGVILTTNSDETSRGSDAGLFWGVYSCSGIVGPAIGFFVYQGVDARGFFLFAALCTLVGTCIFRGLATQRSDGSLRESAKSALCSFLTIADDEPAASETAEENLLAKSRADICRGAVWSSSCSSMLCSPQAPSTSSLPGGGLRRSPPGRRRNREYSSN